MVKHLRKGDSVVVIAGKDKGKKGKIIKIIPKKDKAIVSGVNVSVRNTKPSMNNKGGRVSKEMPLHISNIMILDPKEDKPSRVKVELNADNMKKYRVAVVSGANIDNVN